MDVAKKKKKKKKKNSGRTEKRYLLGPSETQLRTPWALMVAGAHVGSGRLKEEHEERKTG